MKAKVTFVEINIFDQMLPLASGYLQSYASQRAEIVESFDFHKYSATVRDNEETILNDVLETQSKVYALSCYLWNIRLMLRMAQKIVETYPDSYVLMGGPQVMHHGQQYLSDQHDKWVICNGEGEITFSNFLAELCTANPELENVKGLTFYKNGELVTTEAQPRLKSLNEIPSPYNNEIFDGVYRTAVMETNRGCPFRCTYCYWGAATNDKVHKFDADRLQNEISWLGQKRVPILHLADANWGMLKRDIDLSTCIADSKTKFGTPIYVTFSSAKNSPRRVSKIANIFDNAGMMNVQPVSLQTMNKEALASVERSNIKPEAYQELQNELNDKGIGSFIELIWPLPGETLLSFKQGVRELCEMNAASLTVYPNLLLHNTPMYHQREELGIVTRTVSDSASEADLIIATKEVSMEDFKDGLRFYYGALALYNTRALERSSKWLNDKKIMSYDQLIGRFVDYCQRDQTNAFTTFCEDSIEKGKYYEFHNHPTIYHISLHSHRTEFDNLLFGFAKEQSWWDDEEIRFLFELDLISKLYLYSNTPISSLDSHLQIIKISEIDDRTITAELPVKYLKHLKADERQVDGKIRVNHSREQLPFRESHTVAEIGQYCYGRIQLIAMHTPNWETAKSA